MPSGPGALSLRDAKCSMKEPTQGGWTPSIDQGEETLAKKEKAWGGRGSTFEKVGAQADPNSLAMSPRLVV